MAEKTEVTCYAGYKGDERPTSFTVAGQTLIVKEVIDRWYDPDSNYFKVIVEDGAHYLLRHDLNDDAWEVSEPKAPST